MTKSITKVSSWAPEPSFLALCNLTPWTEKKKQRTKNPKGNKKNQKTNRTKRSKKNEKKYSIRIENTRQYSKGYRIRELRLIPVLEVVEELEETEQQKSDDPYLMDTLHYATT